MACRKCKLASGGSRDGTSAVLPCKAATGEYIAVLPCGAGTGESVFWKQDGARWHHGTTLRGGTLHSHTKVSSRHRTRLLLPTLRLTHEGVGLQ